MERLILVSVFRQYHKDLDGNGPGVEIDDATVHVENGVVVCITRSDDLEVRLLITELEQVYHFALEQIYRREIVDESARQHP